MPKPDSITVLIVDDISETHENLKKLLYFEKDIKVIGTALSGQQAIETAARLAPDVILMDINMPGMDGIATTEAIMAKGIKSQIIMMSIQGETDYLRRSMLAGAREFLIKPFGGEELANSIRRVQELRIDRGWAPGEVRSNGHVTPASAAVHERGKIIAVFSPKGGVGRTTIVSNLAVALEEKTRKRVALVDCNLQFGDVAVLFNVHSQKTIADLVPHVAHLDDDLLDEVLLRHSSGVRLLLAPPKPEMAELVTGDALVAILKRLRENYEYVLVDTWPSFHEPMLSVLDIADHILVVLTLELPAIKNVKLFLEVADALGYPKDKIKLVLNRGDSGGGIRVSDVEGSLQCPIQVSIVSDGRVTTQALNQGVPFVLQNRSSMIAKNVFSLAALIAEADGSSETAGTATSKIGLRQIAGARLFRRG
ncbi:MAG: response regulator [Chloroflexi bacterium]|nr:response regulator [Chloroflexota bacterium]